MEYRDLGRTGWKVSSISFGAWAIGGTWGLQDASLPRIPAETMGKISGLYNQHIRPLVHHYW